jgi:hypothetical protein
MMNTAMKNRVNKEAVEAVRRVLKKRLRPIGFERVEVCAGEDHDGEPVLFVEIHYRLIKKPIDAGITFGLIGALREALEAVGETRFPHVRHHFDEHQRVA